MIEYSCASTITDEIICEIFEYAMKRHNIATHDGKPLCADKAFVYEYKFHNICIPVQVQRHGDKVIYLARIKKLSSFDTEEFYEFIKNATENFSTSFIPTGERGEDGTLFAIARCDSTEVHEGNRRENEMAFIDAQINLAILLNRLPLDFLSSPNSKEENVILWTKTMDLAPK